MAKSWAEKLNIDRKPEVETIKRRTDGFEPGASMLIPTPRDVRDYIAQIPTGATRTIPEMRRDLAKQFKADLTCPMVSSIFVRIVAEAAMEELAKGGKQPSEITPFWRVIAPGDKIAQRLSFGQEILSERRQAEGIPVAQ